MAPPPKRAPSGIPGLAQAFGPIARIPYGPGEKTTVITSTSYKKAK